MSFATPATIVFEAYFLVMHSKGSASGAAVCKFRYSFVVCGGRRIDQ